MTGIQSSPNEGSTERKHKEMWHEVISAFSDGPAKKFLQSMSIMGYIEICRQPVDPRVIGGINSRLKAKNMPYRLFSAPKNTSWGGREIFIRRI